MENTYEEYLFEATSGLILECLAGISEEDVRDCSDYKIFRRGQEYYQEGMVEELLYNKGNNTVFATVKGTREYRIEFYMDKGGIYSTCDCPFDGVCKHTVAALLLMVHEGTDKIKTFILPGPTTVESLDFLKKYLKSLSKNDLVLLVMKFAPTNFVTEVQNRELPVTDAEAIFRKTEKKIRKFFEDDELLYDPEGMEKALMLQLNHLKGLETRIATEIGELILFIIRSIEQAFNEGYLYLDNYYQDDYFESEAFCEYVIAYVKQLPFEAKTYYLGQLDQTLNEMSYDTFYSIEESYHRFFLEQERADLKSFITREAALPVTLVSRLYQFLEPELNTEEKEAMLRIISKTKHEHFITLCRLLYEQDRFLEILDLIKEDPDGRNHLGDFQVAATYLEVAHKLNLNMDEVSEEVAGKCPLASLLQKIKTLKGTVSDRCEEMVKQRNPEELLTFYEEENRMKDALALVQEPDLFHDEVVFEFFKKNRKHFPAETESFLKDRIEKDLNHTGKNHYERIVESLDLMKRINSEQSRRIAKEIRANFNRRRNLIEIIRGY
jgi:hypothetical protein